MVGGFSLLTAVELICLANIIISVVVVSLASSTTPVDWAGVRISGYMQCINAAFFLLGIPMSIIGGVGAVYRVESQLRWYSYYLVASLLVIVGWLLILIFLGNSCSTVAPMSAQFRRQAFPQCNGAVGINIFGLVMAFVLVSCAVYLVWSMIQYVRERSRTELYRYMEPWQRAADRANDMAEAQTKDRFREMESFRNQQAAQLQHGSYQDLNGDGFKSFNGMNHNGQPYPVGPAFAPHGYFANPMQPL